MATETSLILFKPDAIAKNLVGTVLARFQAEGFIVRGMKMMALSDEILAEHYSHIADKPFFPSVRGFMQETPVIALVLEGEDVISPVRDLLGPTDSTAAAAGSATQGAAQEVRQQDQGRIVTERRTPASASSQPRLR